MELNKQIIEQTSIKLKKKPPVTSLKITKIKIPIRTIIFYILDISTPFLLYLTDIDRLGIYLDNTRDKMVCGIIKISIIRKWGHS